MAKQSKNKQILKAPPPLKKQQAIGNTAKTKERQLFSQRKLCVILFVLSFLVYANTLKNGYAYDDINVITENTLVTKGVAGIPVLLSTPYRNGFYANSNDFYRPLSLVVFAIEYQVAGASPAFGHFINVTIFACCVVFLFLFFDRLFKRQKTYAAFIASLLFALHPIHTETVANIKSLDDLLCFFFSFLALNLFVKYAGTGKLKHLLPGVVCFFLSLLSKETSITFLAIIPLVFFFYLNDSKKRSIHISLGALLAAIVFLITRSSVLKSYQANHSSDILFIDNFLSGASIPERLATEMEILGLYLKKLLVPYPLICDYSYNSIPVAGFDNIAVIISFAVYCLLAYFSLSGIIKKSKDPLVFAILFYLITLFLFSNILFLIGTAMAERLMFFPSVGFCLAMALIIEKLPGGRTQNKIISPLVIAITTIVFFIYAFITINRNNDWADNYTLYSTDVIKSPNSSRLNVYMAKELDNIATDEKYPVKQTQTWEEAKTYLMKAIAIYPENADAYNTLGVIYFKAGDCKTAITSFKKALDIEQSNIKIRAMLNIGLCYNQLKQYDSSVIYLNKTLAIDPDLVDAQKGLGLVFLNTQHYDSAEVHYKKVLTLKPDYVAVIADLGVVYYSVQKYDQAIVQFEKAIAIDPGYFQAYIDLGYVYLSKQQYEYAIKNFNKGLSINAVSAKDILPLIAISWQKSGNIDSAKKYEAIVQINNPGFKL